ncbi:major capsid protein [Caudoviricetes sp.]|nr:major capsid protein [Caudoviricetes sp.]
MAGATFSDVESFGMLKELYSDDVEYQEFIASSIYNFINKATDVEFDGNYFNIPAKLQINESYAAINDGERLPQAQITKGVFAKYRAKLMYNSIEATNFAATRGHKNGRPDGKYIDDLMKGSLLSFMSNVDADIYGNGRGFRGTIETATPAATSFTCTSTMLIRPGMIFDWYDSTYATKRGTVQIALKGIDRMNKTVYIDTSAFTGAVPTGATAGDVLVVYNALATGEPADGRHIMGLARVTDNTLTIGGLSPTDYAVWMSVNTNASGGNPTQELLQLHWDQQYLISGKYPNRMSINPGFKRAYLNQFLGQRRFNSNSFDTGASSIDFQPVRMGKDEKGIKPQNMEILEDKNHPVDTTYIWSYDYFSLATDYSDAPHLADEDGNEMRFRPGYDSMMGFYRFWANTITQKRNCIGKIYGLATPSGIL